MRKILMIMLAALTCTEAVDAQAVQPERHLVVPELEVFLPHWYMNVQGGAGYDLGEDKFLNLISPAAQLQVGYHFAKPVAIQLDVAGAWAKGRYAYPEAHYSWNFVQPTLDFRFDLPALFGAWSMDRVWNIYVLLGGGACFEWGNDDAEAAEQRFGVHFQKLWHDNRWNLVAKGGLGMDFRVSKRLAINVEANANLLPDHFNSKRGRNDNRDWHFSALLGLHWDITEPARRSEAMYEINEPIIYQRVEEPAPVVVADEPDTVLEIHNVQFEINKSIIRPSQYPTLTRILKFMHANPKAKIQLTGYADKETGNASINERLSRERAHAVSNYLLEHGLEENRIRRRARGDRIQPYDIPEDNRVTVCVIYELIDPESQY